MDAAALLIGNANWSSEKCIKLLRSTELFGKFPYGALRTLLLASRLVALKTSRRLFAEIVDAAAYRRYYEDFARAYRIALEAAERRGEIAPGDCEVRAWALMGLSDMAGRRFALWDQRAPFDEAAEAAWDFVAHGLAPRTG